jgi:hypothetical protein
MSLNALRSHIGGGVFDVVFVVISLVQVGRSGVGEEYKSGLVACSYRDRSEGVKISCDTH